MSEEAIDKVEELFNGMYDNSYIYVRSMENSPVGGAVQEGLDSGREITPGFPQEYYDTYNYRLIPVYEVEWIEVDRDKDDFIENRYEGIRIGADIHILKGKCEDVVRTKDAPSKFKLSGNGIYFINRSNEPYSLVGACMALQD